MNMTSPAIIVNEQDHIRRDNRMLYDEEGLGLHTVNDDGEEEHNDDDQIREQPLQSDQNFSRNSYVYANEEND